MIVCFHCQFQNPDTNRFCQNCGASLETACAQPLGDCAEPITLIQLDAQTEEIFLSIPSNLAFLLDRWRDPDISTVQLVNWLRQIVGLWQKLEPQQGCQSLLELPNLRVGESNQIWLEQFYSDPFDDPPSLRKLGQIWQKLLYESNRPPVPELDSLCEDLEMGQVTDLKQLKSHLESLSSTLVPNSTPTMMSDPSNPLNPTAAESDTSAPITVAQWEEDTDVTDVPDEGDDLPTAFLSVQLAKLEDAGLTDTGRQRQHNEDCFSIKTDLSKIEDPLGRTLNAKGLYILCDGMGGHAGGEIASKLAVDTLQQYFAECWQDTLPDEAAIRGAIQAANRAIYDRNQQNASSGSGRMGTTLVLALIHDTKMAIAHVGDSRFYRFTHRRHLEQLTVDHEVGQREIDRGVEPEVAYARPDAYQLTQALGPRDENGILPDIQFLEIQEDSLLLLCSDGLSDNDLLETHWSTHVEPLLAAQTDLEQGVKQLIGLGNEVNGHDNITAIAIRLQVQPNLGKRV
jgi:protein phosphatase